MNFWYKTKYLLINKTMGQTKRMYEQMQLESLISNDYELNSLDDDYQYELYRIQQLEAEQLAYEECLSDKY